MKALLFAIFCMFSFSGVADDKIETIQLNHRLAVEILPEVQAFLPENATARAFNDFIILKAEPSVISEIKQLINKLDTPLQRLRISVLRTNEALTNQQKSQTDAEVLVSDDGIVGSVAIRRWSTKESRDKDQHYQAQGIAGSPILISMGQDIPQQQQYLVLRPDGDLAVQSNTAYINISSGFQAVARVLPNHQVIVDVHPVFSQLSNRTGVIDNSQIITSVAGAVGTWLEIGNIDDEQNIDRHGTTSYRSHRKLQQTIYLKVDQL